MSLLDRYILRQFLKVLVLSLVSLTGLYIVIDFFQRFEEFAGIAEKLDRGLPSLVWEFYAPRTLWFFDTTSSILCLTAAVFAITWMQRNNEMTAVMAAGISPARLARPLARAALVVVVAAAVNRELVIPRFRAELGRNIRDWHMTNRTPFPPRYDNETDIYLGGEAVQVSDQTIIAPLFRLPRSLAVVGRQLSAATATYSPAHRDRPAGYLLRGVKQPAELTGHPSVALGDRIVIYSPSDTRWLKDDECFVASRVDFEQLAESDAWRSYSSTLSLIHALRNPSLNYGGDVRVGVHARMVQPILDLTMFFLGVPLVVAKQNRNLFYVAAGCAGIVAVYLLVMMGSHAAGASGLLLTPALAAWLPLLLLGPVAYTLFRRMRE